jgi:hypothetical protein
VTTLSSNEVLIHQEICAIIVTAIRQPKADLNIGRDGEIKDKERRFVYIDVGRDSHRSGSSSNYDLAPPDIVKT